MRDEVERALIDLLDGQSVQDIRAQTGLPEKRCIEIYDLGLKKRKAERWGETEICKRQGCGAVIINEKQDGYCDKCWWMNKSNKTDEHTGESQTEMENLKESKMEAQELRSGLHVRDDQYDHRIAPQIVPVGNIFFQTGNTTMQLDVKDDITSRESAHLSVLLTQAMISLVSGGGIDSDWYGYIMEKKLERHFIPGVHPSAGVVAAEPQSTTAD